MNINEDESLYIRDKVNFISLTRRNHKSGYKHLVKGLGVRKLLPLYFLGYLFIFFLFKNIQVIDKTFEMGHFMINVIFKYLESVEK